MKPDSLKNESVKARLLRQYAGIFPQNIVEYAEKFIKKQKAQRNLAR